MKPFQIVLTVFASAAVGALTGILFAPDRGTKTQKKILEKSEGYVDDLKGKFDKSVDAAAKQYDRLRQETEELVTKDKGKTPEIKRDGKL